MGIRLLFGEQKPAQNKRDSPCPRLQISVFAGLRFVSSGDGRGFADRDFEANWERPDRNLLLEIPPHVFFSNAMAKERNSLMLHKHCWSTREKWMERRLTADQEFHLAYFMEIMQRAILKIGVNTIDCRN